MKRRLSIARSLIASPRILMLDEPTTGLDPQTRKKVWDTIKKTQSETGMTVFLTTHYMEEAADADYVIVIDNGKIAAKGTPHELRTKYASDSIRLAFTDLEGVQRALDAYRVEYTLVGHEIVVRVPTTMDALPIIEECRPFINGFEVLAGSMDDAFIGITGKEIRE
ncbi:MAG: hypothetical protein NTV44_00130 [Firmicutes bacterium]|nr:hypothetical protein [Bacillota bacterium]